MKVADAPIERCPKLYCDGLQDDGKCGQGYGTAACVCGHPVCQHTLFSKVGTPCCVNGCGCRDWTEAAT